MKLIWLADTHLHCIGDESRFALYRHIMEVGAEGVLISGDIADAIRLQSFLMEITRKIDRPIYFVLGNHDYHQGYIQEMQSMVTSLVKQHPNLHWLSNAKAIELVPKTVLVGVDGWADGRLGDYEGSYIVQRDRHEIRDLYEGYLFGKRKLLAVMQRLADRDARRLKSRLDVAFKWYKPNKMIIVTHIPPLNTDFIYPQEDVLPFYSSKVMGDMLISMAKKHPSTDFLVLCGHMPGASDIMLCHNLMVRMGSVPLSEPVIQDIFEI